MLAARTNGGGVEGRLAWFPWPVAHLCHTPESNTDERVHRPSAPLTEERISSLRRRHGRSSSWMESEQRRNVKIKVDERKAVVILLKVKDCVCPWNNRRAKSS